MFIGGGRPITRFFFNVNTNRLRVTTPKLSVIFDRGVIHYLDNRQTGTVLLDANFADNTPALRGFKNSNTSFMAFYPAGVPEFVLVTPLKATLAYTVTNATFLYTFEVDGDEILISMSGTESEATGYHPERAYLPIVNLMKSGAGSATNVLLGPQSFASADATALSKYHAPPDVCCVEGASGVVGFWSENDYYQPHGIILDHVQSDHTHLTTFCDSEPNAQIADVQSISLGPVRFSAQSTWLGVVKRWRAKFEARYPDATYVWNHPAGWPADIHCSYQSNHSSVLAGWDSVREAIDPTKLLIYIDLSGWQLLFGDNGAYATGAAGRHRKSSLPSIAEMDYWASKGWTWNVQGYWHFTMFHQDPDALLATIAYDTPDGYTKANFTPDYAGYDPQLTAEEQMAAWLAYWADIKANYTASGVTQLAHPASPQFQAFVLRNYVNFCTTFGLRGCFWDISGADKDSNYVTYNPGSRVINGKGYIQGTVESMALVNATYPAMAEDIQVELIPYFWFCWAGPRDTWVKVNHPFWSALLSSYFWSNDNEPRDDYDPNRSALMGGLPKFYLVGDYASDFLAPFSLAKATLYCDKELHCDLPTTWASGVLNYFRSNTGNWFKVVGLDASQHLAYVEEADGGDVNHLIFERVDVTVCPATTGVDIVFSDTYAETPTVGIQSYMPGCTSSGTTVTCPDTAGLVVGQHIHKTGEISSTYTKTIAEILGATTFRISSAFTNDLTGDNLTVQEEINTVTGLNVEGCHMEVLNGAVSVERTIDWYVFGA